jgi:hypothetical protein
LHVVVVHLVVVTLILHIHHSIKLLLLIHRVLIVHLEVVLLSHLHCILHCGLHEVRVVEHQHLGVHGQVLVLHVHLGLLVLNIHVVKLIHVHVLVLVHGVHRGHVEIVIIWHSHRVVSRDDVINLVEALVHLVQMALVVVHVVDVVH